MKKSERILWFANLALANLLLACGSACFSQYAFNCHGYLPALCNYEHSRALQTGARTEEDYGSLKRMTQNGLVQALDFPGKAVRA
jgi:hypothetical protein